MRVRHLGVLILIQFRENEFIANMLNSFMGSGAGGPSWAQLPEAMSNCTTELGPT